jgi:hypothetical protein
MPKRYLSDEAPVKSKTIFALNHLLSTLTNLRTEGEKEMATNYETLLVTKGKRHYHDYVQPSGKAQRDESSTAS